MIPEPVPADGTDAPTAPCPFCGSAHLGVESMERYGTPPDDAKIADEWWDFYVRCLDCSAEGPPRKTGPKSAVIAWNRRAVVKP